MKLLLVALSSLVLGVIGAQWLELKNVDPESMAAMLAASATVFVSVLSVVIGKQLEAEAQRKQDLRERKIPIYEAIVAAFFETLFAGEDKDKSTQSVEKIKPLLPKLITWGSDDVVDEYSKFRNRLFSQSNNKTIDIAEAWAELLLALRKDLGHANKGVSDGSILQIFINDPSLRDKDWKDKIWKDNKSDETG